MAIQCGANLTKLDTVEQRNSHKRMDAKLLYFNVFGTPIQGFGFTVGKSAYHKE
jgi:hypothetical protein